MSAEEALAEEEAPEQCRFFVGITLAEVSPNNDARRGGRSQRTMTLAEVS
jgi:hypothetical protein